MAKLKPWPAREIEHVALGDLLPYPNNPNKHTPEQVELIRLSMVERGWTMPILVDEANMILAGHGRVQAAQKLVEEGSKQFAQAPCVRAVGWSKADKQAYVLADNQLTRASEWDTELLKLNLGELVALDYNMNLTGFSDVEIAKFAVWGNPEADPEATPEPPKLPTTRAGDLWLLGKHRLMCGDATEAKDVAKVLVGAQPHLMVTDPPYGVNYDPGWRADRGVNKNRNKLGLVQNDDEADWSRAYKLFSGDVIYAWSADLRSRHSVEALESVGFIPVAQIIWAKDRFALGRGDYHFQHEPLWYAVRKGRKHRWSGDRTQTTVWNISAREDGGHGHGTQKPIECMRRPITNNSKTGEAVYDPFVGSGTTIIAAEMTKRVALALEINPAYVDVAVLRWQQYTGQQATLAGTRKTFAQVAKDRTHGTVGRGRHPKKRRARVGGHPAKVEGGREPAEVVG